MAIIAYNYSHTGIGKKRKPLKIGRWRICGRGFPNGTLTYWHREPNIRSGNVYAGFKEGLREEEMMKFRPWNLKFYRKPLRRLTFGYVQCYVRNFGYDLKR